MANIDFNNTFSGSKLLVVAMASKGKKSEYINLVIFIDVNSIGISILAIQPRELG
jgi:hypothetical protein